MRKKKLGSLVCFLLDLGLVGVLEVEEHKREDEDAEHHREGAGVVRIGARNEALVLGVGQRTNGDLKQDKIL